MTCTLLIIAALIYVGLFAVAVLSWMRDAYDIDAERSDRDLFTESQRGAYP